MSEAVVDRDVVLITGASTGIGRAAALHLAGKGLRVLAGVRKASDGEVVAQAFAAEGRTGAGSIEPLIIDVADGDSIARAVTEVGIRVRKPGVVLGGPLDHASVEIWRRRSNA